MSNSSIIEALDDVRLTAATLRDQLAKSSDLAPLQLAQTLVETTKLGAKLKSLAAKVNKAAKKL